MTRVQQPPAAAPQATPQAAQEAARVAQQEAQQAAQQAAQTALEQQGIAGEDAGNFRIVGSDGKVVTVGPEGIVVTRSGQAMPPGIPQIPVEAVVISVAFFVMVVLVVVGWPIARAIARRMDHRSAEPARVPADQTEQLRRIEQAVEAMAIEVERVSENQRFVTRLLSEKQPEGALLVAVEQGRGSAEHATPEVNPPH